MTLYQKIKLGMVSVIAICFVITATYISSAYYTQEKEIDAGKEDVSEIVQAAFSDINPEDITYGVNFDQLDMDVNFAFQFDPVDKISLTGMEINHELGEWEIKNRTARALRKILGNLRLHLIDRYDAEIEIKIMGVADSIPVRRINGTNRPYMGKAIKNVSYRADGDVKKTITLYYGESLSNESIAFLRANEAAQIVNEVLEKEPDLYATVVEEEGVRKAIIGIRTANILKYKYDEMNNLEKKIFDTKTFITNFLR